MSKRLPDTKVTQKSAKKKTKQAKRTGCESCACHRQEKCTWDLDMADAEIADLYEMTSSMGKNDEAILDEYLDPECDCAAEIRLVMKDNLSSMLRTFEREGIIPYQHRLFHGLDDISYQQSSEEEAQTWRDLFDNHLDWLNWLHANL
jgi:hypothetical protein